jgi:hypothetical protein
VVCFAALLTSGAGPRPDHLEVSVERVAVCGAAMAALNPEAYLPDELSTVFVEGCPVGQVWCSAVCCRCCNPQYQVCCDATCNGVCAETCSSCYAKR